VETSVTNFKTVNIATIVKIKAELETALIGRRLGKIFQLSRFELAVDFRLADSSYVFISIEPVNPRIYLIRRRVKDLEKQSGTPSSFQMFVRKRLSGAVLEAIRLVPDERVLRFEFSSRDELGIDHSYSLAAQLTGRSANLFLQDENGMILETSREPFGEGQMVGDIYAPPLRAGAGPSKPAKEIILPETAGSLSEALDNFYLEKSAEKKFLSLANAALSKSKQEIGKREKLIGKLNGDLTGHGNADKWKRFGDLLLANVANATREGGKFTVTDYYDENLAQVVIETDENDSLTESAEKFFKRYTKARNAREEIAKRVEIVAGELTKLKLQRQRIEEAIDSKDEDFIADFIGSAKKVNLIKSGGKKIDINSGSRTFNSSDGFEILVGKKAKDNDFLTFRVAKSLDLWMHAADYPGSHVVIRNPNRKEIPQRTLLEAAHLAAFYSQGKSQPKAAVHYTQKKFVNKPKGSAPGLVSLASFKTLLVEPKVPDFAETGI